MSDEPLIWSSRTAMLLLPLLAGAAAIWWMLPRRHRRRPLLASLVGLAALGALGALWIRPSGEWVHDVPFYLFSGGAIGAAVLMITDRDPVHAALWFAITTLSVCGLFLLRSAAFLAAATLIVYAGAIIVVFLFVIMLARQSGETHHDHQASQPLMACVLTFVLLGGVLFSLESWRISGGQLPQAAGRDVDQARAGLFLAPRESLANNPLSDPVNEAEFGTMRGLGRSLFGDYLYAVEVAGTLLVVAAVGAIAIAPRTRRGTL